MKVLPSKLFPNCSIPESGDAGFFDFVPEGFCHKVNLYLGKETVADDKAIEKAAKFFDQAAHWDEFCREIFHSFEEGSEDSITVMAYFNFYKEEAPEVFGVEDLSALTLMDMIHLLAFDAMASHESGGDQKFVVDFTLGYDQILCVCFDSEFRYQYISWDS